MFYLNKPTNIERNADDIISVGLELSWIILSDLSAVYIGFSVAKATAKMSVKWMDKIIHRNFKTLCTCSFVLCATSTNIYLSMQKICKRICISSMLCQTNSKCLCYKCICTVIMTLKHLFSKYLLGSSISRIRNYFETIVLTEYNCFRCDPEE